MAITRQAKNYKVIANKEYQSIIGGKLEKYADDMTLDAIDGNLKLGCNKKIVSDGGCEC